MIGSLHQFFPSKEAPGDAILDRFSERLYGVLEGIEERSATSGINELVNAWLGLLDGFQEERAAASALMASRMSDTVMFNEVIA